MELSALITIGHSHFENQNMCNIFRVSETNHCEIQAQIVVAEHSTG
jgi:hypothetical protein